MLYLFLFLNESPPLRNIMDTVPESKSFNLTGTELFTISIWVYLVCSDCLYYSSQFPRFLFTHALASYRLCYWKLL